MTEKRMAQEFEIIQAVSIGPQEVVLGYAKEQKEGLHFMTAFCEQNELFAVYHGMSAEKFLWVWLRSELLEPKQLRCQPTNLYYEILKKEETGK